MLTGCLALMIGFWNISLKRAPTLPRKWQIAVAFAFLANTSTLAAKR
jgi:hypothetical protein